VARRTRDEGVTGLEPTFQLSSSLKGTLASVAAELAHGTTFHRHTAPETSEHGGTLGSATDI
jgi:hypothetical protein